MSKEGAQEAPLLISTFQKSRRVRASEGANRFKSFFRRHVRRKNSLGRSLCKPLAPTNRRAMEREYPLQPDEKEFRQVEIKEGAQEAPLLFIADMRRLCGKDPVVQIRVHTAHLQKNTYNAFYARRGEKMHESGPERFTFSFQVDC